MTNASYVITVAQLEAVAMIFGATISCQEDSSLIVVDGDFVSVVFPDGQIRQEDTTLSRSSDG